jgi:uncharacterized LabA/DUF88 family protein
MSIVPAKHKVNVYVDGFNLYHAIDALGDQRLKWINLWSLGFSFIRPRETLNRVVYFTARLTWNKEKQQRHEIYIAAQKACGVDVVESNFRKVSKHCKVGNRYCDRYEEKQTDVAIAVSILTDALKDNFRRAILITADSDQIPLVTALHNHHPDKFITLAAPPGRGSEARQLGSLVDERTPIKEGRLRSCLLPQDVYDGFGKKVAARPAKYASA